ncbi:serine/threonine-protein kinase RsbW [Bacillus mesophilus]|uniref:Serine-protein kinase RsbW n=1 Tax=Bacillus mesophilus TaxID=1808955 RepID=A0A6M0QC78_9BACI|nr:serine/threonine-protein kinase RsbW [Bacillus mesophilus]NEY73896.1 anti-sigma B factor RsbW [Bacillus mesophilus]
MNQSFDYIEMKVPSKPEYVGVVRLTLSGIASRMGYSYEDIEDLKIATSEAITNAVHHAYNQDEGGEIVIGFGLFSDHLQIMVSDNGKSFDINQMKEDLGPYSSSTNIYEMNEGGLGLYLIDTLMDDVKINNDAGVSVFMKKYLQRERVGSDEESIATNQAE